jgi:hypothetical protein
MRSCTRKSHVGRVTSAAVALAIAALAVARHDGFGCNFVP